MKYYIGLDIGGTKCASILAFEENEHLTFLYRKEFTTTGKTPEEIINRLILDSKDGLKENNLSLNDIVSVGVSCGGPLNSKKGIILCPPNLSGWVNIEIVKILEEKLKIPAFLQNDAKACAIAEQRFGAGKGTKNMIFCTMGTGFGAGIIIENKIYTGTNDMAGEVGHIRLAPNGPVGFGKAGSFEGFCSGGGITLLGKKLVKSKLEKGEIVDFCNNITDLDNLNTKIICENAQKGNKTAMEIIKISADKLGYGLSILIDTLNPEAIVIGSVYARNENLFKPFVEEIIEKETISYSKEVCKILPAKLGDSIGDYGAIVVASYGMEEKST